VAPLATIPVSTAEPILPSSPDPLLSCIFLAPGRSFISQPATSAPNADEIPTAVLVENNSTVTTAHRPKPNLLRREK
jgi:hypothetical protein